MRIRICAIGKVNQGPEYDLVRDYTERFNRIAPNLGLGPCEVIAIDAKKSGAQAQAAALQKHITHTMRIVVLDERGKQMTSPDFAHQLAHWRDLDNRDLAILIGGADGLDPQLRQIADLALSFGAMVWPHFLARVMLAEQLYRAASILAGTPYHRQ